MDNGNFTRTYVKDDSGKKIGYVAVNLTAIKEGKPAWRAYRNMGNMVGTAQATKDLAIALLTT
jgi:hypothetical protein